MKTLSYHHGVAGRNRDRGFTMIEVAISLAIIAFALVAIIGVLPAGMQVQKDNREETIIDQDAALLIDIIRNGATNYSVLSNNLEWIVQYTNVVGNFSKTAANRAASNYTGTITAQELVGIMSTPKYLYRSGETNLFQYDAKFLSNSGPLGEQSGNTRDLAFSYLVSSEIVPFSAGGVDRNLTTNLYEMRMIFRWPVYPNGTTGLGRQVYRAMLSGTFTNDASGYYYFRPNSFLPGN